MDNELLSRIKLINEIFNERYKCNCYFSFDKDNIIIKVIMHILIGYFKLMKIILI